MFLSLFMTYVNLVENIISLNSHLITICLFSRIIFFEKYRPEILAVKHFSHSLKLYMTFHVVCAISTLPYHLYMITFWQPNDIVQYKQYVMFYMGILDASYVYTSPLPVLYLTTDRCLSFLCPESYNENRRQELFKIAITVILTFYSLICLLCLLEIPLDLPPTEDCVNFACMMLKYQLKPQLFIKLFLGCVNTTISILFFILVSQKSSLNIKNRVVRLTLIVEICFNIVPTFLNFISIYIIPIPLDNYLGQYMEMFSMLDAAFCAIIYTKIFVRKISNTSIKTVFVSSSNITLAK